MLALPDRGLALGTQELGFAPHSVLRSDLGFQPTQPPQRGLAW